jgi:two-component system OmpR family response regulator
MLQTAAPTRVLVVDDDRALRSTLLDYFDGVGMHGIPAASSREVTRAFAGREPDVVILDLQLGSENGLDILRDLRLRSDVPILIASGQRCEEADRVVGLELGADDYLTKPFGLRELTARIKAVLRRKTLPKAEPAPGPSGHYRFAGWQLSRRSRRLLDPEGNQVPLTKGEFALLVAFLESPERPLTREQLLQATRVHEDIYDRSIDVQILRLRRKLEKGGAASVIRTVRGVGYVFACPVERR